MITNIFDPSLDEFLKEDCSLERKPAIEINCILDDEVLFRIIVYGYAVATS